MKTLLIAFAAALPLAGCTDGPPAPDGTEIARNGVVMAEDTSTAVDVADATASGPNTAFGLTRAQLDDAEVIGAGGVELGEVEQVLSDASGTVTMLIVEVGDSDRDVQLPVRGLRAVKNDGDWDLQTAMSGEELLALPDEDTPLPAGVSERR